MASVSSVMAVGAANPVPALTRTDQSSLGLRQERQSLGQLESGLRVHVTAETGRQCHGTDVTLRCQKSPGVSQLWL